MKNRFARFAADCVAAHGVLSAHAEGKIRIAQQFGIGYLLLDVIQDQKLIEKHAKAMGLDVAVE